MRSQLTVSSRHIGVSTQGTHSRRKPERSSRAGQGDGTDGVPSWEIRAVGFAGIAVTRLPNFQEEQFAFVWAGEPARAVGKMGGPIVFRQEVLDLSETD